MLNISKIQLLNQNFLNNSFFKFWNLKLTFFYSFIFNKIIFWHINPIILNMKKLTEILKKIISYGYNTYVLYDHFIFSKIISKDKQISSYFFYKYRKGFLTNFTLISLKKRKMKKRKKKRILKKLFPSFIFCLDIEQDIRLQYIIRECNKIEIPLGAIISKNFDFWGISYPIFMNIKALSSFYFFYKFIKQLIITGLCLSKKNFIIRKTHWYKPKKKLRIRRIVKKKQKFKIKKKWELKNFRKKRKFKKIKKKEREFRNIRKGWEFKNIKKKQEFEYIGKKRKYENIKKERKFGNIKKKRWLKSLNF